jgi:hypothetical protein
MKYKLSIIQGLKLLLKVRIIIFIQMFKKYIQSLTFKEFKLIILKGKAKLDQLKILKIVHYKQAIKLIHKKMNKIAKLRLNRFTISKILKSMKLRKRTKNLIK